MVPRGQPWGSAPADWESRVFRKHLSRFLALLANCKNVMDTRLSRLSHIASRGGTPTTGINNATELYPPHRVKYVERASSGPRSHVPGGATRIDRGPFPRRIGRRTGSDDVDKGGQTGTPKGTRRVRRLSASTRAVHHWLLPNCIPTI